MDGLPSCTIPGNPDIAGVGVRASVYIQACLALVAIGYWAFKAHEEFPGYINDDDARLIRQIGKLASLTGTALILSALIEARSAAGSGLTIYHALVVLNLSWLNTITASLTLWSAFHMQGLGDLWQAPQAHPLLKRREARVVKYLLREKWPVLIHCALMTIMGIWFWADPRTFSRHIPSSSDGTQCVLPTYYWLFFRIDATNPRLRIASLFIYSLSGIPILNDYVLLGIGVVLIFLWAIVFIIAILLTLAMATFSLSLAFLISLGVMLILKPLLARFKSQTSITILQSYHAYDSTSKLFKHFKNAYWEPLSDALLVEPVSIVPHCVGLAFASPVIVLVVATEFLLVVNRKSVDPGVENRWSYGQTLALFAALISVGTYLTEVRSLLRQRREMKQTWDDVKERVKAVLSDREGEWGKWGKLQAVTGELERLSWIRLRPKVQDTRERDWNRDIQRLFDVLDGPKDEWEQLRRIAAELAHQRYQPRTSGDSDTPLNARPELESQGEPPPTLAQNRDEHAV